MAGHSKFKNIQHRKGAQDAKRARLFARLVRDISIAARDGDNPDFNPRLRSALNQARNNNVPKDNIERALKAKDSAILEEITYAGYAMAGVAVIVDTTTDNHRRTAASVRAVFSKMGFELVERSAVLFQFEQFFYVEVPKSTIQDEMAAMEYAEAFQAINIVEEVGEYRYLFPLEGSNDTRSLCEERLEGKMEGVVFGLLWYPQTKIALSDDQRASLDKLIGLLEEIDCVDGVYTNAE